MPVKRGEDDGGVPVNHGWVTESDKELRGEDNQQQKKKERKEESCTREIRQRRRKRERRRVRNPPAHVETLQTRKGE